ncbi:MAG: hypothetical protein LC105_03285 [Chitinophagales bacterium]|nr:hypothetical protein [Chitinophagales bacterium]
MEYIIVFIFILILINVKLFKVNTSFFNSSLNLLLITGLYAIIQTKFNSIFTVFLAILIVTQYKKTTFSYDLLGLKKSLIYGIGIGGIVYSNLYKVLNFITFPYVDDVFYSRVATWIGYTGIENTLSQSNHLFVNQQLNAQYYHWFELWLTNFIGILNHGNAFINLFIVITSIVGVLICLGIHEIIERKIPSIHGSYIFILTFLMFLIITLSSSLWNTIIYIVPQIPKYGSTTAISNILKTIYVVPICLSIYYVFTKKENGIYYPILFSFFYLTTFPAIVMGLIFTGIIISYQNRKIEKKYIIPFLALLLFVVFYKLNADSRMQDIDKNPLSMIPNNKHMINWFIKSYIFIPIGWFVPIVYLYIKRRELKDFIIPFVSIYISSSLLWLLLYTKADAQQLFGNLMDTFFYVLIAILIIDLLNNKKYVILIIVATIHIIPLQKYRGTNASPDKIKRLNFIKPYLEEKIIFLNSKDSVSSIYRYSENNFCFSPEIYLLNSKAKIYYPLASYPILPKFNHEESQIIESIRKESIYFQSCGELNFKNYDCLLDFMKKYQFTTIFSEFTIDNNQLQFKNAYNGFYIYKIKP